MAPEPTETTHTVVITDVRDEITRKRVAHSLAKVTRNITPEKIRARLHKLPWTLTRNATSKRAARLVHLLERLGATVKVIPPLPMDLVPDVHETQILPGAHMLSETQIASSTQFLSVPKEHADLGSEGAKPDHAPSTQGVDTPKAHRKTVSQDGFDIEPMTLGGILDRSFQICRGYFWKLLAILAIPWLIITAMTMAVVIGAVLIGFNVHAMGAKSKGLLIVLAVTVIPSFTVIALALFYLAQGALIHAVSSIYLGREIFIREAYRFVVSRLGRYFLTSLLFLLAIFGLTVAPIIFGIMLFFALEYVNVSGWWSAVTWLPLACVTGYGVTKLILFDKVVIIENVAYGRALGRSWSLTSGKAEGEWPRGYFLRLSLMILIFLGINIVISLLFQTPITVVTLLIPQYELVGNIVGQILSNIGNVIAGLFSSVCMVVFYYDIRNRKEGFDLKMLSRMDNESSEAP